MKKYLHLLFVLPLFFVGSSPAFAQTSSTEPIKYQVPDINGRATLLVQPELSGKSMMERDGTTVVLKVTVDESGAVIAAECSPDYPVDVKGAAEAAAKASKFRPLIVNGQAVKYQGSLMYTVAVAKVDWFRFGLALYSTYIFDNISLGPVAAMLTSEFADEKVKLAELDNRVELKIRWSTIEAVRDSLTKKLGVRDRWVFGLAMGVRKVTAPFQSDRKLDRNQMQVDLANLKEFADTAPADVEPGIVDAVRAAAAYKIDPAIEGKELYRQVMALTSRIYPNERRKAAAQGAEVIK